MLKFMHTNLDILITAAKATMIFMHTNLDILITAAKATMINKFELLQTK